MEKTLFQHLHENNFPRIGMGTWSMGEDASAAEQEVKALRYGLELGMKIIDTAEMYADGRSESIVGEALAGRREDAYLVSKVLPNNASYDGVLKACERSLKNLKTDYIDLYLLHWQGHYSFQETIDAFEQLKTEGKIKAWGVSNMDVDEMEAIQNLQNGDQCQTNQVLYNLSRRGIEYDLLPWQQRSKMPVMAYSPIEQGRLLGVRVLKEIAEKHSATPAQIALAWVLRENWVIPIPKTSSEKRMKENFEALNIHLEKQDLEKLDKAFPPPAFKMSLETI